MLAYDGKLEGSDSVIAYIKLTMWNSTHRTENQPSPKTSRKWDQDKNEEPGRVPNQYAWPEIEGHQLNWKELHHNSHPAHIKYQ